MNNYSKSSAKNNQPKRTITATHKKCKKNKKPNKKKNLSKKWEMNGYRAETNEAISSVKM